MKMRMRIDTSLIGGGRLFVATFHLMLLLTLGPAMAVDRVGDEFLTGYVTSVLERDMHWESGTYILKIVNGVATITLFEDDPLRREEADKQLRKIDGLAGVAIRVRPADTGKPGMIRRLTGLTGEGEVFPPGDMFQPLLADPRQPQFFASVVRFRTEAEQYEMAAVGFGETYGLYRFFGAREGDGLQLGVEAAMDAQFNLDTSSMNLINADYTIGMLLTYRSGANSMRLRLYHLSSHLGDEYLQSGTAPTRVNLSYEAVEFIYSREWREWRLYGGGEFLSDPEPDDLKQWGLHWGIEYRGSKPLVWNVRPLGGVDMKSLDEHDWAVNTSIKAGIEFGHPNPGQRRVRFMGEWYKGHDPHGQFYVNKSEYYGMSISLGF